MPEEKLTDLQRLADHESRYTLMQYRIKEYINNEDNSVRYVLSKYDSNPLIVFGINPSTATEEKNDRTIAVVEKIVKRVGCDGYIMLNLYPLRAKKIDKDFPHTSNSEICAKNLKYIRERIFDGAKILAAWGTHINDRGYFIDNLEEINKMAKEKNAKWICLNRTKDGHPWHPNRKAYEKMTFEAFNVNTYIDNKRSMV